MSVRAPVDVEGEPVDPELLRQAEAEARGQVPGGGRVSQIITGLVLLAGFVALLQIKPRTAWPYLWIVPPLIVFALVGLGVGHARLTERRFERKLREALNRRGLRLCVQCGYSLRGLSERVDRCPECGSAADTPR